MRAAVAGALIASVMPAARVHASPAQAPLAQDELLQTLIAESLAMRPELAQARALEKAERERGAQLGAMPDPMLQLGIQNDGFRSLQIGKMETSFYSVMAQQTFPWPGKLQLRSEIADFTAQKMQQSWARGTLSTEAEVRRAYLALVLARERLALLERLEALFQKSAAIARTRYETGEGAQSDVLRAQLELNRLRKKRTALGAAADNARLELNRLRGRSFAEPIEPKQRLSDWAMPAAEDDEALARDALERSPELATAKTSVRQAESATRLAHKGYLPDLTLSLGVMFRGGPYEPMWLATLGVPIPVFAGGKQSRAIEESAARTVASEASLTELEHLVRLRAQQRGRALRAVLETIELYRAGLLVQSQATADSTLTQYQVGKVPFAAVLDADAGLVADEDGYLEALAEAHGLEIERREVSLNPVRSDAVVMGGPAMAGGGTGSSGAAFGSKADAQGSDEGASAPGMRGM